jgi:hypothetical protein
MSLLYLLGFSLVQQGEKVPLYFRQALAHHEDWL